MNCPRCGQLQIDENTRFCSRCGFLLTAVAAILANDGNFPQFLPNASANAISPRKRGLKQGVLLIFSGAVLVPLMAIISMAINIDPTLTAITAILTFVGGILRVIYALLFEDGKPQFTNQTQTSILPNLAAISNSARNMMNPPPNISALPPQSTDFSSASPVYQPPTQRKWQETNELVQPPSVTENTTKFLENQD